MDLMRAFKEAQEGKDWRKVSQIRELLDKQAESMSPLVVSGITGQELYHFQGGIGLPPAAIKLNGKWVMLDSNDPRRRKVKLIPPTTNRHGLSVLRGWLYKNKSRLPLITIDDLLALEC